MGSSSSATTRTNQRIIDLQVGKSLGLGDPLGNQFPPVATLVSGQLHRPGGSAARRGGFYRLVDLAKAPVQVRHDPRLNRYARLDIGRPAGNRRLPSDGAGDVSPCEEAVGTHRIQGHQDGDQGDEPSLQPA